MRTSDRTEACVAFASALLRAHQPMPRSPDDPVPRCACGRPVVLCEINSAGRDAGLLAPITGTPTPGP